MAVMRFPARFLIGAALVALVLGIAAMRPSAAQIPLEGAAAPHWIWSSKDGAKGKIPAQTRYFRKRFEIKENGSTLSLDVTADNAFVLFLDGRDVLRGADWHSSRAYSTKLPAGWHALAAECVNDAPGSAGFLVRGAVTPLGQVAPVHTDESWHVAETVEGDDWKLASFDDSSWARAEDLGPVGIAPWTGVAWTSGDPSGRFTAPRGFSITCVAPPELTGSVVAFNFDAQGRPCVSIERGPILRLIDKNGDGTFDDKVAIAPGLSNSQGFTFHKDALFGTGLGPDGTGIYRLKDRDGDGIFETPTLLRASTGPMQEHGLHAVVIGPEGSLYLNNGNHARLSGEIDPLSPHNIAYEGEILPHLNDPRGHAVGIRAPAGEILRSDDEGKTWSRVSAGYRNQYDFAFNLAGEPFTFDSDMEWDFGLPWYRPTRVLHAVGGGEFGSRNGSAVWPSYFIDGVPPVLDIGRGSPTGVTFYQARTFPPDFFDNLLLCDWSQGRILAVSLEENGGTYNAKARTLVSGQPLNCTDIEVGPDGAVYFSTGGRSTLGGLYRVAYTAPLKPYGPPTVPYTNEAIGIDSPRSSFGRARIAAIKESRKEDWGRDLLAIANDAAKAPLPRVRAMQLLAEFGPSPSNEALARLAADNQDAVRREAVSILGTRRRGAAREALIGGLSDPFAPVRRLACEGLVRSKGDIPVDKVAPLLNDPDRSVRYAARIAIEHGDLMRHRALLIDARSKRARIEGMLATVRASAIDEATEDEFLAREMLMWQGKNQIVDLFDLLRLTGLTFLNGPRKPADCPVTPPMRERLLGVFQDLGRMPPPARDDRSMQTMIPALQCEVARLLALLDEPKAVPLLLKAQEDEPDPALQIHYAYCLRVLKTGWSPADKARLWAWYELASRREGGYSVHGYLDYMVQDLVALLSPEEAASYLADAAKSPFPSRVLVRNLDLNDSPEKIAALPRLYAGLAESENAKAAGELRTLILEKLGAAAAPEARAILRELARTDPSRRDQIARALSNKPTPGDLPLLVSSLESRDPNTTSQVVSALERLEAKPSGPDAVCNLLRLARRTGPAVEKPLATLMCRWMPDPMRSVPAFHEFGQHLSFWEGVYRKAYPEGPSLDDPSGGRNSYTLAQLLTGVLQSPARKNASADRGRLVIARVRCLDCHKLGDQGQALGPDLTTVSSRFRPGEILESIAEPSRVISDQYKSLSVATTDGKVYNGMPAGQDDKNLVLLLSDGTKVTIPKADIEEQKESKVSVMPEGLIDGLSYQEIADLLALFESQGKK
jgi:putative heme-binding domain-containing protein